jgi:hypothetical protein
VLDFFFAFILQQRYCLGVSVQFQIGKVEALQRRKKSPANSQRSPFDTFNLISENFNRVLL